MRRSTLIVVVILVVAALSCITWVGAGAPAVRESLGGQTVLLPPGPHLRVPLYHRVYHYDAPAFVLDEALPIVTRDQATFKLPCRIAARVSPGDVLTFHAARSGRDTAEFLKETVRGAILNAARQRSSDEILLPGAATALAQQVSADLIARGIADDGLTVGQPGSQVVLNVVVDNIRRQYPATARKLAEASLKADPHNALSHTALGAVLEAEGNPDGAEAQYLEALYLDPTAAEPMSRLFVLYQKKGDPQAIGRLERLLIASLEKKKDSAVHHDWLGQVYMRTGQTDKAEMAFNTAINLSPKTPEFRVSLGTLRVQQKRYDDARTAYEEALKLKPDHMLALYNLGVVSAMQGKIDEAIGFFEKAAATGPPSVALLNSMAQAYEQKGDLARAAEALRRSLKDRPDQPERVAALHRVEAGLRKKS
jgi:tetratricopeptide (TPR) repeat protein